MSGVEGSKDMEKSHYPAGAQRAGRACCLSLSDLDEPDGAARHAYAEPKRHGRQSLKLLGQI
jgi:hypothetical protein